SLRTNRSRDWRAFQNHQDRHIHGIARIRWGHRCQTRNNPNAAYRRHYLWRDFVKLPRRGGILQLKCGDAAIRVLGWIPRLLRRQELWNPWPGAVRYDECQIRIRLRHLQRGKRHLHDRRRPDIGHDWDGHRDYSWRHSEEQTGFQSYPAPQDRKSTRL